MLNYIDMLDRAVRHDPERAALIDERGSCTFAELQRNTSQFARALLEAGFPPETRFAALSPNANEALLSLLGGLRAGGAWCNINLRNALETNVDILSRGGCEVLFFHSSCIDDLPAYREGVASLRILLCLDQDIGGYSSIETFMAGTSHETLNVVLPADGIAFQGATGGTTGAPKLTQGNSGFLTNNALGFIAALNFDQPPVNLAATPITHAAGLIVMTTLAMGGTAVLMSSADQDLLLENIEKYRVSFMFLPPTLVYMLMNHPRCATTDFSSLRYLLVGAAPFAVEKIAQAHKAFGPVVCQAFGQTECGFPLTFMSPAEITEALASNEHYHRLGSIGRQTATVGVLDILSDEGKPLPPGEVGEIVMRGPSAMLRYLNDPDATAEVQQFGWHHTGDLGYMDEDGYFYVSDRKRDLIISGGFNVFPLEIEQILARHPAVQDSAVIGVPHEKWGEAVKAVVELAPGAQVDADELIALCKTELGGMKAPKSIDFVAELPRSAVGKVLKRDLRRPYWEGRAGALS